MEKEIAVDGMKVAYSDQGLGKTLLLFHGWGASKEAFAPLIEALSENFRVVALDFPGFGRSDEPKKPWAVGDYAEFTQKFIRLLALDCFAWIAHSFGGRVAIKLAAGSGISPPKIILMDSAGIKPGRTLKYYIKIYSYKAAKHILLSPPLRRTGLYERLRKNAGSSDYKALSDLMRATMSLVVNEDLRRHLPAIKSSVLLIWGDRDTATPISDAKIMESLIPDCGLAVMEGAGHYSYLEELGKCLRVIFYFLSH